MNKMIRDIIRYSYVNLATSFISFILLPFYTHYLNSKDFGIIAIFLLFGPLTCNFLSLGLGQASLRFYYEFNKNNDHKKFMLLHTSNIIFISLIFFIFYLIIFKFSEIISFFLFKDKNFDYLIIKSYFYGVNLFFVNYFYQLFIAQKKSKTYSIFYLNNIIFSHVFSFFFILSLSLTFEARINGLIGSNFIILLVLIFFNRKLFTRFISPFLIFKSLKFSYPNIPNALIAIFSMSIDKIILAKISSLNSLGILDVANRFSNLSKMAIDLIGKGWTPYFMDNVKKNDFQNEKVIKNYQNIIIIFSLFCFGLVTFSFELVHLLTSKEFHSAYQLVQLMVINFLFTQSITIISLNQIFYAKKLKYTTLVSIINLLMNTILCLILIPKFDVYGVVYSIILSGILSSILYFYFAQKVMFLTIKLKKIFFIFILFLIFTLFIFLIDYTELNFFTIIFLKILIILIYIFFLKKFLRFNIFKEIYYLLKNNVKKI
jgi:O-antigen/teichoic acid export membrane protein